MVDRFKASRTVVGQGYEIKVACCFDCDSYLNAVAYFECIGRFSDEFPGFIIEIEFLVDLDIGGRLFLYFLHRSVVLAVDGSPCRIVAIAFYGQFVALQCAEVERAFDVAEITVGCFCVDFYVADFYFRSFTFAVHPG